MTLKGRAEKTMKNLTPLDWIKYALTAAYFFLASLWFFFGQGKCGILAFMLIAATIGITVIQILLKRTSMILIDWGLAAIGILALLSGFSYIWVRLYYLGSLMILAFCSPIISFLIFGRLSKRQRIAWIFIGLALIAQIPVTEGAIREMGYTNEKISKTTAEWLDGKIRIGEGIFSETGSIFLAYTIGFTAAYLHLFLGPVMILSAAARCAWEICLWAHPRLVKAFSWFTGYKPGKHGTEQASESNKQRYTEREEPQRKSYQQPHQDATPYMVKEAFEFLGLETNCTKDEFKRKYRERQKALHPDGKDEAQQKTYNDLTAQLNKKANTIRQYMGW